MGFIGKLIGTGLGFSFGGPLGALVGLGLGWLYDSAAGSEISKGFDKRTPGDFIMSLLVLMAAVMKADGKIMKSELDYVKQYLVRQFGPDSAADALKMLRDLLKQDIPVREVCTQVKSGLDYSSRLQLLHILYGIAASDSQISSPEVRVIDEIAYYLGISNIDHQSIKSMFVRTATRNDISNDYKILGVSETASEDEIKKAYRRLANENHPDKVSYLGEEFRKDAEEKFRKINDAYERIKKQRNIM